MGYFYLLCVALLFSFGGTCVKLISPYFNAGFITFFRFVVGVFFLLLLKGVLRRRFQKDFWKTVRMAGGWIVFGAAAKWLAYWTENYALSHGVSYGNIVTQPAQTVFLTLVSIFFFKEKMSVKKAICILMCMLGVLCISWNGRPLDVFFGENILLTALFWISGTLAGGHVLAQKMIADKMDIIDSNLSIFAVSAVLAGSVLIPDIAGGGFPTVAPNAACIAAILMFGFITGIGFYLNAKAIPLVPFYMVPILQSTMVLFSITWGILFFHEEVSVYIIVGTVVFVAGLVLLQLLNAAEKDTKKEENDG